MKNIDWNEEKDNLIKYLKEEKLNYKEIGKIYGRNKSTIREAVIRLGLEIYSCSRIKPKPKLTKDQLICQMLDYYTNSNLRHTRDYLISNLTSNIKFRTFKGIMLKEDFIEQYEISRKTSEFKFNYDFSLLPNFIKNRNEKVSILVNEISPKTGKYIGLWKTNFKNLVVQKKDNSVCGGIKSKKYSSLTTEEFIERSKEKFGEEIYFYDKVKYINNNTDVLLGCKKCGNYFYQNPTTHLCSPGLGCPNCVMKNVGERKILGLEELSNRCENIYGQVYDFSNSIYINNRTNLVAVNKITGKPVIASPEKFLYGNPESTNKISRGESLIISSLEILNLHYKYNYVVLDKIMGRQKFYVKIDFRVIYNEDEFWIEYNGEQHYKYINYFGSEDDFVRQIVRDENVKMYCQNNNLVFIEIPYTYNEVISVCDIIRKIIIDKNSPKEVIDPINVEYPKNYLTIKRKLYGI